MLAQPLDDLLIAGVRLFGEEPGDVPAQRSTTKARPGLPRIGALHTRGEIRLGTFCLLYTSDAADE